MRILIFLVAFSCHLAYSQETWINFIPQEPIFQVLVPGTMDWGTKHVLTSLGEMKTITYLYKGLEENPDPIYIINYTRYPQGSLDKDSTELLEEFFQTSLAGILTSLAGELVYMADISNVYTPQKLYKIHYNKGLASVKGKLLVEDDVFYSIQVFSSFQKSQIPEIDKFLDSFQLLKPDP